MIDGRRPNCHRLSLNKVVRPDGRPGVCPCHWSSHLIAKDAVDILNADRELAALLARLLELMP